MKGGHANSGPAPDPNALRRERDGKDWISLPAEGRSGDPPTWPLSASTKRERDLWAVEWRRPQAVMWQANHLEAEVAMYVRSLVAAEKPDAPTIARTLLLRQQENLGISLPGMNRLHWRIEKTEATVKREPSTSSARDRLKVVNGAA